MKTQQNKRSLHMLCAVVIVLTVCVGYQYLVKSCNVIFPINYQEVFVIQVKEYNTGKYSAQLIGALKGGKHSNLIEEMNALQPIGDGNKIEHTTTWLHDYHIRYMVTVHYRSELSRLRRASTAFIYYADNGVIIADYGGYTKYHTNSEDYDEFLLLLEEYAEECFISAY